MSYVYSGPQFDGGSQFVGNTLLIQHRWHVFCEHGKYLVTINWGGWTRNINAIVNDFGELVPV